MADNDGQWERGLIEKLATAALKEQRRARLLGHLLQAAHLRLPHRDHPAGGGLEGARATCRGKHTALVEVSGVIAPGTDASAERVTIGAAGRVQGQEHAGRGGAHQQPGRQPGAGAEHLRRDAPAAQEVPGDPALRGGRGPVRLGRLLRGRGRRPHLRRQGEHRRLDRRAHGQLRRHRADGKARRRAAPASPRARTRASSTRSRRWTRSRSSIAQALLDDIHQQFIDVVREGRGKRLKETPDMFTGLIWTGQKSVELGLADASAAWTTWRAR